ncbi:hypothetical protein D3C72_1836280 [compost metagenome]
MLVKGVADIGVRDGSFALEGRPGVQEREVVVLQDAEGDIAAAQAKTGAHHVGDAVGQPVQLAERVAPAALDVDQRFLCGELHGNLPHDAGEVHVHCCLRGYFWGVLPEQCRSGAFRRSPPLRGGDESDPA